jgi:hypothetical protein
MLKNLMLEFPIEDKNITLCLVTNANTYVILRVLLTEICGLL